MKILVLWLMITNIKKLFWNLINPIKWFNVTQYSKNYGKPFQWLIAALVIHIVYCVVFAKAFHPIFCWFKF